MANQYSPSRPSALRAVTTQKALDAATSAEDIQASLRAVLSRLEAVERYATTDRPSDAMAAAATEALQELPAAVDAFEADVRRKLPVLRRRVGKLRG